MKTEFEPGITLTVSDLWKTYANPSSPGAKPVIAGLTLSLHGPQTVAVVGKNGTGKTTLLRLLSGLEAPQSGGVRVNGQSVRLGDIGYVAQSNPVYPWRRVIDDIAMPLEIRGVPKADRRSRATDLASRLAPELDLMRRSHGLSGGQRQVVNICRALIGLERDRVLLLDEPFSALDPGAREDLVLHLETLQKEFRALIVLTTHQVDLAITCADEILCVTDRPITVAGLQKILVPLPRPRDQTRNSLDFLVLMAEVNSMLMQRSDKQVLASTR